MTASIFAKYATKAWPHRFEGTLVVSNIHGGVPADPKTVEGWLKTKVLERDAITQEVIAQIMAERGVTAEAAVDELAKEKVNGFHRDSRGLYVPGNNLKACLKEAVSVAANAGKITTKGWGVPDDPRYKKGIKSWFPEHVFVVEDRLHLGADACDEIDQRFTRSQYGSSITREEVVREARVSFTIETDHKFTDEQWAMIWLTAEQQGLGASRSQGFGRFAVTRWDSVA
jgi:hypothetical protein